MSITNDTDRVESTASALPGSSGSVDYDSGGDVEEFPKYDSHDWFEGCEDGEYNDDYDDTELSFLPPRPGQLYYTWDEKQYLQLEDFEQYRPGGHHPVILGDFLGEEDRFQVWHKMGQGTYGLIWLCRDLVREKFCAVKVLRAELSKHADKLPELRIKEMLGDVSIEEAWENHLAIPMETFVQNGPNGEHLCIVTPLLGPSITESRRYHWNDTQFLKDICFQLVEGMDFMHSRGLGHGDFRPSNILFKTTLGDLTEEEMDVYLTAPDKYEIVAVAEQETDQPVCGLHAPLYAVEPLALYLYDECITKDIAIIDFGVSFEAQNPAIPTAIPDKYAAPECHPELGTKPSKASDLWALGCTIAEVLGGEAPFQFVGSFRFEEVELVLGPMPEPYRSKFAEYHKAGYPPHHLYNISDPGLHLLLDTRELERRRGLVREDHETDDILYRTVGHEVCNPHPNVRKSPSKTIDASFVWSEERLKRPEVPEIEGTPQFSIKRRFDREALPGAVDLLRKVLRWFPEDRVAAQDLLNHEWFEGRRRRNPSKDEEPKGPTFEDIFMDDIPLPTELSVKKEDLPPPPQIAGGSMLVGPQTWRLNEIDMLHNGPFVPKSMWGFFQKALCMKPRK